MGGGHAWCGGRCGGRCGFVLPMVSSTVDLRVWWGGMHGVALCCRCCRALWICEYMWGHAWCGFVLPMLSSTVDLRVYVGACMVWLCAADVVEHCGSASICGGMYGVAL